MDCFVKCRIIYPLLLWAALGRSPIRFMHFSLVAVVLFMFPIVTSDIQISDAFLNLSSFPSHTRTHLLVLCVTCSNHASLFAIHHVLQT